MTCIEKYSLFEYRFTAKVQKPFSMEISARFLCPDGRKVVVRGFYDGEDTFAVRFMPEQEGLFRFEILCGNREINGISGAFECVSSNRHGRVIPKGKYLETIDGSRHFSAGTTCYAWIYQPEYIREETIAELGKGYFNKIRMCVFPKHYLYNEDEPDIYPFVGTPGNFHYDTPNVKLFQRLDACVARLNDMDIQADIILFHPYDKDFWGFSKMNRQQDEAYIRYVTARLGAYANVWWSAANEYDLFRNNYKAHEKSWGRILRCIRESDSFGHMLGIHQCLKIYDHRNRNLTHCSLQRTGMYVSTETTTLFHKKYRKPVVWDEINYEGNIKPTFGNCTPQELVRHFWEAAVRGAYAGHGETYASGDNVLWWSKGGKLHGISQYRIRFLREVMADYGNPRLVCCSSPEQLPVGMEEDEAFVFYYGNTQSQVQDIVLPQRHGYQVEIIDTWNMERFSLDGLHSGVTEVPLGGKPFMAVFARKADPKPLPERFDGDCLLRDMKHYRGGKLIYWLLTHLPILGTNTFVLYDSLRHLQTMAPDAVTDSMIARVCDFVNEGKIIHLLHLLKKE